MRTIRYALPLAVSLALALPAAAAASVSLTFDHWEIDTADGKTHDVAKGGTFRHCAGNRIEGIVAAGTVHGATKGDANKAVWRRNGESIAKFPSTWKKTDGHVHFGIQNEGGAVPTGGYGVTVRAGGKALASTAVKIAKKTSGC
jgi:hypothetical protein